MKPPGLEAPEDAPDPLCTAAEAHFGVTYLYPYQRLVIANTIDSLDGEPRRQIVVLPTGSGKTLCFTLPAVIVEGLTVVVYPLLSLMADQLRRARDGGLSALTLQGGQPRGERDELWRRLGAGSVRLLLTNPEMLGRPEVMTRLAEIGIAHLVIDEAHCVSEWGETFRPAYLELGNAIERLSPHVVTAFTATASPIVLESVRQHLFGGFPAELVQGDPDRPNIDYSALPVVSKERALRSLFCGEAALERPAVVFCRSRAGTETVARMLIPHIGHRHVGAYHAGLSAEERAAVERWFFDSAEGVLAATCAYGMGVDKRNIRTVVHYELPASVEAFLQESGRAGRDGARSVSVALFARGDARRVLGDDLRAERARVMLRYAGAACKREYLLEALGSTFGWCGGCDHCRGPDAPLTRLLSGIEADHRACSERIARVVRTGSRVTLSALPWIEAAWRPDSRAARSAIEAVERRNVVLAADWTDTERSEAIAGLIASGQLSIGGRGPRRGVVRVGRRRSRSDSPRAELE